MEEWRAIPGYEGWYEASSEGRIRAIQRPYRGGPRCFNEPYPLILTPLEYRKGYTKQHLGSCNGLHPKPKREFIHRIIYRTFHGPIPSGMTVNHKDGDKRNQRPENLELATHQEQHTHARTMGLPRSRNGKRHHLTADDVRLIRTMAARGVWTQQELAHLFNIAPSNIRWIVIRRTWRHVT